MPSRRKVLPAGSLRFPTTTKTRRKHPTSIITSNGRYGTTGSSTTTTTALNVLLDVPEGFFTITFAGLGLMLSMSKNFARIRMEERAWEQRLEEGRQARMERDPTLTEIDLRRQEAAMEWSAYGKPRMEEEQEEKERRLRQEEQQRQRQRQRQQDQRETVDEDYDRTSRSRRRHRRHGRVAVAEKEDDDEQDDDYYKEETDFSSRQSDHRMTDEEIAAFELEYGVDYDPYYDDPYTESELPEEPSFSVDKRYGDRIYDNGEIFYKDASTGLFYRQGAKPRNLSFWN